MSWQICVLTVPFFVLIVYISSNFGTKLLTSTYEEWNITDGDIEIVTLGIVITVYFFSTIIAGLLDIKGKRYVFLFWFNYVVLLWACYAYWHWLAFDKIPVTYDNPWYLKAFTASWLISTFYSTGILIKTIWNALIWCIHGKNKTSLNRIRHIQNHFD